MPIRRKPLVSNNDSQEEQKEEQPKTYELPISDDENDLFGSVTEDKKINADGELSKVSE